MKCVVYYHSGTGNTELACRAVAAGIRGVEFELADAAGQSCPGSLAYDVAGFAFPTYYMGVPRAFIEFLLGFDARPGMPVFLLNTFGMMQGRALKTVEKLLRGKGCRIIAWHALCMPESYPPFIARGFGGADMPGDMQLTAFRGFIGDLSKAMDSIGRGEEPPESRVKIGFFNSLMGAKTREKIIAQMGELKADASRCARCGACVARCPAGAVKLEQTPVFDSAKCEGCWSCFNHCPQKAIFTNRVNAAHQYAGPDEKLAGKLL